MATKSIKINFLSHLLSFLNTNTVIGEVTTVQPKIEDAQLLQMLSQQKHQDLTYVWKSDEHGQLHGSWVKSSCV